MNVTSPLQKALEELHERYRSLDDGEVATYIPELGRADPSHFGICLMTVDGHSYCVGDTTAAFTIQSISKPFVYALALEDQGVDRVLATVGVEPSGEAFNAISLEQGTGRPRNPMINAGAIAAGSLVAGAGSEEKFARTTASLSGFAGRALALDEEVYRSERETGHRNRAIAYLLRNNDIVGDDVEDVLDRYFRQCSLQVTATDLATMAATLAHGGTNPRTSERVVSRENVAEVLSVMSSCGMYDYSGSWLYRVGMPAKSGVAGGIVAVLPGQFGIGVYSPKLDAVGNSVRGVAVCEAISDEFSLHLLDPPVSATDVVASSHSLAELRSTRRRDGAEVDALSVNGRRARVFRLQGWFGFSAAEAALHRMLEEVNGAETLVLDCRRVHDVEPGAWRLFDGFVREFVAAGGAVAVAARASALGTERTRRGPERAAARLFDTLDGALEWAEDRVLRCAGVQKRDESITIQQHPSLAGLSREEIVLVLARMTRQFFPAGGAVLSRGDVHESMFLLVEGHASVSVQLPGGQRHRLAAIGPGAMFGELSFVDGEPAIADITADTDVVCYVLPVSGAACLPEDLRRKLLLAIAHDLAVRLRRADEQIRALAL